MTCREAEKMIIPYIHDDLSMEELDDFLDHVEICDNCMEELEINYMVDIGLKKLDTEDTMYDIVGDLMRKLENSGAVLQRFNVFQITRYAVSTLKTMAVLLMILLQIRIWVQSGFLFF